MSHVVTIQTKVQDRFALEAACRRLQWPLPTFGTAELYSGSLKGWQVQLPGWRYPLVVDLSSGNLNFDNFGGNWGEQARLDLFLQSYAVEKTRIEARKKGMSVSEQLLQDGSIRLQLTSA